MMQIAYALALLFIVEASYSQDTAKLKSIDSIVNIINTSELASKWDSLNQDKPALGLKMTSYVGAFTNKNALKKYVNRAIMETRNDNKAEQLITSSTFYFDNNKLIKVEEYGIKDGKKSAFDWYYENDKPLYYTSKKEESEERAQLLLSMGTSMLNMWQNK